MLYLIWKKVNNIDINYNYKLNWITNSVVDDYCYPQQYFSFAEGSLTVTV